MESSKLINYFQTWTYSGIGFRTYDTYIKMKPCKNFIKRKHPRKGEQKKQGAKTKV
jgi:hypothetical protein